MTTLIKENRKFKLDETRQLEAKIDGVKSAISQLDPDLKNHTPPRAITLENQEILATPDIERALSPPQSTQSLSVRLSSLAEGVNLSASNQALLKSIWFDRIGERQANVAASHEETFKWILDPASSTEFSPWLRSRDGIFWIKGKAGSGKSTLMKHLINHPGTMNALQEWAGSKPLFTASYFLWKTGTPMQKTQEGLFRSLLFEILRKCPDMIQSVCAFKAATFKPFIDEVGPWTREDLWQAIGQLQQYSGVSARFCFFIDGLDEYDGDPDHLLEVLESLRCWKDIKLCVSSRPWNEFVDAFDSDPHLALEDLTKDDIRIYVHDTLEKNSRFKTMEARDNRSQELVQEIVDRASG